VDSSSIQHFDLFANAPNVEKLVGSGAFTINDILREANKEPINEPWADTHFMTLNISDMSQSTRQLENGEGGENSGT
ncbi:MAG: phage portal protein, partial [Clostridia bacterium]|nr:phage portal protein [Clostridia bacterium]